MSVMEDLLSCQWGQQLLSDYHVVKRIHVSPMSEVFALESSDGRQRLILKAMKPAVIGLQMLETLKTVPIDGVVPIFDFHITDRFAYVIKPYIEGLSLQDFMVHGLTIEALLDLMKQLVKIVSNCHSQSPAIILRDIKPDNLMICQGRLCLLDMESSKLKAATNTSRDTVLLGTPGYAAPEQYGFQTTDERTDVYAIGQVMNNLLERVSATKANAFTGNILQRPLLWSARRIAKRATSFDPAQRFQSSQVFGKALEGIYPRIYMSFMTAFVLVMAVALVGFQSPGAGASGDSGKGEEKGQNRVQSVAAGAIESTSESESSTQESLSSEEPPTTKAIPSTEAEQTTSLTTQETKRETSQETTQSLTRAPTESASSTDSKYDVRFSGNLGYSGEVPKGYFLITMVGISDPSYSNQFSNPVTFSSGNARYSYINRSTLITGDRYKLTGYLDLNGNFDRDAEEPTEVISNWTFNGSEMQTVDFLNLVAMGKTNEVNTIQWMPGVTHLHQAHVKSFKTMIYRSKIDPRLKDFDAFTVLGTNVLKEQATEFIAKLMAQKELKGLAYASPSKDYLEFNSVDSYADQHIIAFLKGDKLLGYVYIYDGQALPYVIFTP